MNFVFFQIAGEIFKTFKIHVFQLLYRNLLAQLNVFSEHEIMTVGRRYAHRQPEEVDMNLVLAFAQEKLKKKNFEVLLLTPFVHKFTSIEKYIVTVF